MGTAVKAIFVNIFFFFFLTFSVLLENDIMKKHTNRKLNKKIISTCDGTLSVADPGE